MSKFSEVVSQNQQPDEPQRAQQPLQCESRATPYPASGEPAQSPPASTQAAQWARIPAELRARHQWVVAGTDKRPLTTAGNGASSTDPSTWTSFDEACSTALPKGLHIGYMLHPSDPFTCIDLDVKETTSQEQHQRHDDIVAMFDSYTERSRGGQGRHVWITGKIGKGARRDCVEVYSQERFIICTGDVYADRPIAERQQLLDVLVSEMRSDAGDSIALDGKALPNMALAARAADDPGEMGRLFRGDWNGRSYPSQSEADLALVTLLLPECESPDEAWATFLLSKLGERDKAKRRGYAESTMSEATRRIADSVAQIQRGKQVADSLLSPRIHSGSSSAAPLVELLAADMLKPEPIRWLWPGWLARGKLHVLAGAPGTGKTTLAMSWAATISSGSMFPDEAISKKGRVIIWSGEDDPADTLLPRLIAANADLGRVHFVGDVKEKRGNRAFDPATDIAKLEAAAPPDVALIVVDPLVSAVAGDSHKNAEVRRSLAPLVELAMKLDAALIGITHYSKGTQGRDPLERVSGSLAFGALARIVFCTAQQGDDDAALRRMVVARAKSNIGPDGGGFLYGFEQVAVGNEINTSKIVWDGLLHGTARDLLEEPEADETGNGPQIAMDFLRDVLAGGPMAVDEVKRRGTAVGFSFRALQRALKRAGFKSKRQGFGKPALWSLD